MKKGIIFVLVAALSVVFLVEWASARGNNNRFALDQEWKQVRASQEQQDKEFKAIEQEAERSMREMDGSKGSRSVVPSNRYQRQRP